MKLLNYTSQCSSTNEDIVMLLKNQPANFLTLYTFCQTQGRGQYGNTWEMQSGKNLAFSFVLSEEQIKIPLHLFNFHTANILREFVDKKTGADVRVKWPNDIIIKNKKVSGMLIERKKINEKWWVIIGIGVNILQKDFDGLPKAGSLFTQTGKVFELMDWATEMHECFVENILKFPMEEELLRIYNQYLYKRDEVSVFVIQGLRQNGIIQKVDNEGYLWIKLEKEGVKRFFHKEVEMEY